MTGILARIIAVAAVAGLAAAATGGDAASATLIGSGGSAADRPAEPATPVAFTVSGSVTGLFPGSVGTLTLRLDDLEPFAIVVTTVTTTVAGAPTGCPPADLAVAPFLGGVSVGGHRSATVTVAVTLSHSTPDACQGALFALRYAGTARKG
jgi:hypothetical protein